MSNLAPVRTVFDPVPIETNAHFHPELTDEEAIDALWSGKLPYTIRPSASFPGYYTLLYTRPDEVNVQKTTIGHTGRKGFVAVEITQTTTNVMHEISGRTVQQLVNRCREM